MSDDGSGMRIADAEPDAAPSGSPAPTGRAGLRSRFARHPRTSAYLLRSAVLAASTTVVVSVVVGVIAAWGILARQMEYRDGDGYRITGGPNPATWSDAVSFSPAGEWYSVLGTIGSFLWLALAVVLLLVQPATELGGRWARSRGFGAFFGLVPVAVVGLVICVIAAFGITGGNSPAWLVGWTSFGTIVWLAVVYGLPILLVVAAVIGLATLADRGGRRRFLLILGAVLAVAVVAGSIGLFRPPALEPVVGPPIGGEAAAFTQALEPLDGVASVEVVGAGATVLIAADAGADEVLAAAQAARQVSEEQAAAAQAAEIQPAIVMVVMARESSGTDLAADDPQAAPWRLQLVPSEFPAGTLTTQVDRLLRAEALGVQMVITGDRPAITVSSIAALPGVVAALAEIAPDGAYVSVPERFSMVFDPLELSPAMVDAIVGVVVANPNAEFELTAQPKLYVNHVTPEAAAAIDAILRDPALAGTSPSGYPAEYQIHTIGPDGDVYLEGTFG
ncbi:hypothetical protein [Plantibacter cousiniae (nom. nud.)]|uniref:hypothetical protein n=1 Tax=Plantibacter cousiniae (nom. nud.) TaxID=199709 RepID=UPI001E2C3D57|nr:hypothetical protein [Plantibacter cousiniae]